ncbi:MAG TPA: preprotein translocase subunit SecG [Thermoanaerobaculia bacterium]|nr:preprotein translocase subunit SecG [Thermoanaerobaculia bacterium]
MIYLLYVLHILVCVFLILVVLLQQGKGADLSMFAGGSTQTAFGARGATTLLHKLTVASFLIFILTTLAIGIPQFATSTVMSGARAKSPAAKPGPIPGKPASSQPAKPAKETASPAAPPGGAPPGGAGKPVQGSTPAPAGRPAPPAPARPPGR